MHKTHNASNNEKVPDKHGSHPPSTTRKHSEATRKCRGFGKFPRSDSSPDQGSLRPIKERGRGIFPRSLSNPTPESLFTMRNSDDHKHPSVQRQENIPARDIEKALRVLGCLSSGKYKVVSEKSRLASRDSAARNVDATKSRRESECGAGSGSNNDTSAYFGNAVSDRQKSDNAVDGIKTLAGRFDGGKSPLPKHSHTASLSEVNHAVELFRDRHNNSFAKSKSRRGSESESGKSRESKLSDTSPYFGNPSNHRRMSGNTVDQKHTHLDLLAQFLANSCVRTRSDKSREDSTASEKNDNTTVKRRISSGSAFYCNVVEQQQFHNMKDARARVTKTEQMLTAVATKSLIFLIREHQAMCIVFLCCQICCISVYLYGGFAC